MKTLKLVGPFRFQGPGPGIDDIPAAINGVYLWCVKAASGTYRVHYVGEARDVAQRQRVHQAKQLRGQYAAFCPDGLARNEKILMHRANEGMIQRFSGIASHECNQRYLGAICIFYADLGTDADKRLRCTYESALVRSVEDHGPNVLHVLNIRRLPGPVPLVTVATQGVQIEALSP